MNYRKNAILFLYVTVHEKAKIKNCFFSVSKAWLARKIDINFKFGDQLSVNV